MLGPLPGNAFWAGLGTARETQNDGDPIVQYDQLADRWLVSQFGLPNFPDGPFPQCIAASTTPDPTGSTTSTNAAGEPAAFCPARAIPNDQMAVFLVRAFGLAH